MAMYESDITQFLKTLKQERPSLEAEQRSEEHTSELQSH